MSRVKDWNARPRLHKQPRFPRAWLHPPAAVSAPAGVWVRPLRRQRAAWWLAAIGVILLMGVTAFWWTGTPKSPAPASPGRERVEGMIERLDIEPPHTMVLTLATPQGQTLEVRCDTGQTSVFMQGGVLNPTHLKPGRWVRLEHEGCVASQVELLPGPPAAE